jgi:death-on-curing protein
MISPVFLTVDEVIAIHTRQISVFGGLSGIKNYSLLESAVMQSQSTYDGVYLHKNIYEMAAAYLFHLAQNPSFHDGNKRVGLMSCDVFLMLNGYEITAKPDELTDFVLEVASGNVSKPDIARFLRRNTIKLNK